MGRCRLVLEASDAQREQLGVFFKLRHRSPVGVLVPAFPVAAGGAEEEEDRRSAGALWGPPRLGVKDGVLSDLCGWPKAAAYVAWSRTSSFLHKHDGNQRRVFFSRLLLAFGAGVAASDAGGDRSALGRTPLLKGTGSYRHVQARRLDHKTPTPQIRQILSQNGLQDRENVATP